MKQRLGKLFCVAVFATISSCAPFVAKTPGEISSGYTYVPIDPFAVNWKNRSKGTSESGKDLLALLPDNAVRMSVEKFDASGKVTYNASSVSGRNETYRVTVDYINSDTTNVTLWITKWAEALTDRERYSVELEGPLADIYRPGSESYTVSRVPHETGVDYSIPIYVGIGLRVTANITTNTAKANISGLGVIGAEAEAHHLRGTLTVQTLGVNGKSIAAALPIQSELNRTTAQNAIVAVGAIKALLYEQDTVVAPRVVGIYLPFPAQTALTNAIVSELSRSPIEWK